MFRTRRKSLFNNRRRSIYSPYRKKHQPLNRWQIALAVLLTFIGLELLTHLVFEITGRTAKLEGYENRNPNDVSYGLNFVDESGHAYKDLPQLGKLSAEGSVLQGYTLLPTQDNQNWSINEQGFRSEAPTSVAKSKDEVRIFVMGGSAAFGQFSSSNSTTFASQLQSKLNNRVADQKSNPNKYRPAVLPYFADEEAKALAKPAAIQSKQYKVINAAVPGHVSSNQLARLVHDVLPYQPDWIILLNGYDDLLLPSSQEATQMPASLEQQDNAIAHLQSDISRSLDTFLNRSLIIKSVRNWILKPNEESSLVQPPTFETNILDLPQDRKELELRAKRFENNLEKIAVITSSLDIPMIAAIQPEVTSRLENGITDNELEIINELNNDFPQLIEQSYGQLREALSRVKDQYPGKVLPLTLQDLYHNNEEQIFLDPIHFTDDAHAKLATKLYGAITSRLEVDSISFAEAQ